MAGPYTQDAGSLAFYEVLELLRKPVAKEYFDTQSSANYIVWSDQWISTETVRTAALKGKYIAAHKLAGAMFWEVALDNFQDKKYDLIRTVKKNVL